MRSRLPYEIVPYRAFFCILPGFFHDQLSEHKKQPFDDLVFGRVSLRNSCFRNIFKGSRGSNHTRSLGRSSSRRNQPRHRDPSTGEARRVETNHSRLRHPTRSVQCDGFVLKHSGGSSRQIKLEFSLFPQAAKSARSLIPKETNRLTPLPTRSTNQVASRIFRC